MDGLDATRGDIFCRNRRDACDYDGTELRLPSVARKGFLPLVTTRGDRLFIGLLLAAYINLAWAGLTDLTQWIAAAFSALALTIVMRWG